MWINRKLNRLMFRRIYCELELPEVAEDEDPDEGALWAAPLNF